MAQQFGAPNFAGNILQGLEAGYRQRERNKLWELEQKGRELSGQVLSGQQNKLAELLVTDPDRGMKVKQFTDQEKARRLDELAAGAMAADTPEKWQAFVQRSAAQGHKLDPGETRESILDQAMGWKEKLAQSNADRQFNAAQKNSDRQYQLDVQQFGLAQANANWQRKMDQAKLDAQSPDLVELYDGPTGQPYKARYNPKTGDFDRVGGIKAPNGTQLEVGPDGTVSFSQGMGKITEGQSKDISYLNRMLTAAPILDKNDEALTSFGENVAGNAPLVGNYMKSSQFQQAEQAGRNFLTALLRKESGAQIPPSEERSYGDIFIPRPGDKKEVIAQKREARRQAAIGIRMGLPAPIIKGMIQQGVDFSTLDAPPNGGQAIGGNQQPGGKDDNMGVTPQGVDPNLWQYMTPEERALWK